MKLSSEKKNTTENDTFDLQIKSFCTNYPELSKFQAGKIVHLGYAETFEALISAGISIKLFLTVIADIIPRIGCKGLDVSTITEKKLLEILLGVLNGKVDTRDLYDCLLYIIKFPNLNIPDVIQQFTWLKTKKVTDQYETQTRELKKQIVDMKQQITTNDHQVHIVRSVPNKKVLSTVHDLTFTLEKIDTQFKLIFYQKDQVIATIMLPFTCTEVNIRYILLCRLRLPFIANKADFVEKACSLIFRETRLLLGGIVPVIHESTPITPLATINHLEGTFIPFFANKDILYKVEIAQNNFYILFVQNNNVIGQLTGVVTIAERDFIDMILAEFQQYEVNNMVLLKAAKAAYNMMLELQKKSLDSRESITPPKISKNEQNNLLEAYLSLLTANDSD